MSKDNSTKEASQAKVPDLDELITHITNNGNFKTMMDSISGGLNEQCINTIDNTVSEEKEDKLPNALESSIDEDISTNPNFDLMSTFFTDTKGQNIADILTNINNNLDIISNKLTSK